jgi:hypothetical protein
VSSTVFYGGTNLLKFCQTNAAAALPERKKPQTEAACDFIIIKK